MNKDTNPKDLEATMRAPLHLVPVVAITEEALAFLEGMLKYDEWNYFHKGARASVYIGAAARHIARWYFGSSRDPHTRVHHLGSARACLGILLECEARGQLVDDRPSTTFDVDAYFATAEHVAAKLIEIYGEAYRVRKQGT